MGEALECSSLTGSLEAVKRLNLAWDSGPSPSHHQLWLHPAQGGAQLLDADISGEAESLTRIIPLHLRQGASYELRACQSSDCVPCGELPLESLNPNLVVPIGFFKATDTAELAAFGTSVVLSPDGRVLVVGAPRHDGLKAASGAAYAFVRGVDGEWVTTPRIDASLPNSGAMFGASVTTSSEGARVVVGASHEEGGRGAAYTFERSGDVWLANERLAPAGLMANDWFGMMVEISSDGTTLAVAAPALSGQGRVFVFTYNGEDWGPQAEFDALGLNELTGMELAADGQTLALGVDTREVRIFRRSGEVWAQAQVLSPADEAVDGWGWSVSLSADGSVLAVGAPIDSLLAPESGAVRLYTQGDDQQWTTQATLRALVPDASDGFGFSVELSAAGDLLFIGVPLDDSNAIGIGGDMVNNGANDHGAIHVYTTSAQEPDWLPYAYVKAKNGFPNAHVGASLAVSGDGQTLAVGVFDESSEATGIGGLITHEGADSSGAVYVY